MEKHSFLEKKFHEILSKGAFEHLEEYRSHDLWPSMSQNEKFLLAKLFITYGENLLIQGDNKALDLFALALRIAPNDPTTLLSLGKAYSSQVQNLRCLKAATQAFRTVLDQDEDNLEAWIGWGSAQLKIGQLNGDINLYYDVNQHLQKIAKPTENHAVEKVAELHWIWGKCWYLIGKHSGEAQELTLALEKYKKAKQLGLKHAPFFTDSGAVLTEMALLLKRNELLHEALDLYQQALKMAPNYYPAQHALALAYHRLFEFAKQESDFINGHENYAKAAKLNETDSVLWLNWGTLLIERGKQTQRLEAYQEACEKFKLANQIDSNNYTILSRWAEAEILWGAQLENLELLKEAERKIIRSLEIYPDDSNAWYIYGSCLNEQGRYFEDDSYYQLAIEKFKYGLNLNKKNGLLWYGLASSYLVLGELQSDEELIEYAVKNCEKASALGENSPQFVNDWGVALMQLSELTNEQVFIEQALEKFELIFGRDEFRSSQKPSLQELRWLYNYGSAYDFLGSFSENSSDFEKSIQILSIVVEHQPDWSHAQFSLALAYSHLGENKDEAEWFHKSLEHFECVASQNPEDEVIWHDWAITLMNLAELNAFELDNELTDKLYEQAEEKLLHAVAIGSVQAFYSLACLYSILSKFSAAMHYIERAELAGSLPSIEEVMSDELLEKLRDTPAFRNFISLLSSKRSKEF